MHWPVTVSLRFRVRTKVRLRARIRAKVSNGLISTIVVAIARAGLQVFGVFVVSAGEHGLLQAQVLFGKTYQGLVLVLVLGVSVSVRG